VQHVLLENLLHQGAGGFVEELALGGGGFFLVAFQFFQAKGFEVGLHLLDEGRNHHFLGPVVEPGQAFGDDGPDLGHGGQAGLQRGRSLALDGVDVVDQHAGHLLHVGGNAAGHAQVHKKLEAEHVEVLGQLAGEKGLVAVDGGNDDIGLFQGGHQVFEVHEAHAAFLGQSLGLGAGAVADGHVAEHLAHGQVAAHVGPNLPQAHHQHARVGHVGGQLFHQLEGGVAHAGRPIAEAGFGLDALVGEKYRVQQAVQKRARRVGVGGPLVGHFHLIADLQVAHHLGIKAHRHFEQVLGSRFGIGQQVEIRQEGTDVRAVFQVAQGEDDFAASVVFGGVINLGAVAGTEHQEVGQA